MLVAAIFIILVVSTIAAYILRKRQVVLSRVWMIMAAVSVLLWLSTLVVPHDGVISFMIENWFSADNARINLTFSINSTNWPLILTLLTVHIAFLLVSGAKQELNRDFIYWVLEAGEVAVAYAVITAADLWTVIIAWTAMDIGNLAYDLFFQKKNTVTQILTPMIFKFAGSLLLIYATAISSGNNQILLLENIPVSSSGLFLTAAILHSGVLPYRFPTKGKKEIETVTNIMFYLIPFISSMFLIAKLPEGDIPFLSYLLISVITIGGMFYFGVLWMRSRDELKGIYYLSLAFTASIIFRFITGSHQDLVPWLVLLLLGGSWLVLFSHRGKSTRFFQIFMIISMMGIPFTLTSYGNSLLFTSGFKFSAIFILVFHVLFLIGSYTYFAMEKEQFDDLDSSSQLNYLIALVFSLLAIVIIAYRSAGSLLNEISNWWAGLLVSAAGFGYIFWQRRKSQKAHEEMPEFERSITQKRIENILSFDWLIHGTSILTERIRPFVNGFSNLMEGEGGILWSIVFLALLVTLLRTG